MGNREKIKSSAVEAARKRARPISVADRDDRAAKHDLVEHRREKRGSMMIVFGKAGLTINADNEAVTMVPVIVLLVVVAAIVIVALRVTG